MFDELFNVFVYKREDGSISDVEWQGVYRVIGDIGVQKFQDDVFNYACDGFVVEVEKFKK